MPTPQELEGWKGRTALDADGDKIGSVEDVYLDRRSGDPEWLAVKTGLLGRKVSFVPLRGAELAGDDDVRLVYSKDRVKDAPSVDPDGELSPDEERALYEHYERSDYDEWTDESEDRTGGLTARDSDRAPRELGDASTDDAMIRSEEDLRVGTERRAVGRARLRKYVTTEQETRTVPVEREDARVVREPITDENVDQAMSGPEIAEAEHEVTLHADEPVVEKRVEPKERVRLEKDVQADEETVSGEVRKERVEADGGVEDR
jgi:stress response protein YsnF